MNKKLYSLPKKEIIKSKKDFEKIIRTGKKFASGHIKAFFQLGDKRRVGFAVSNKIKGAVRRNKIKRWLREIYRREKYTLNDSTEIIILVDYFTKDENFHTLKEEVLQIFKEINENFNKSA